MNNHTPAPWTLDADGFTRMEDQIQCLRENQGTQHEWTFVGKNDEDGFALVTALAHPSNAEFIVRAVNNHDELVAALKMAEGALSSVNDRAPCANLKAMIAHIKTCLNKIEL